MESQVIPLDDLSPAPLRKQNSLIAGEQMTLTFNNIGFKVIDGKTKQEKVILSGVSGIVHPGEVLAVMGPSGAGKSTLLELLGDRLKTAGDRELSGTVRINGRRLDDKLRRNMKFVQQQECLIGVFSVQETLYYAAELTLPVTYSRAKKDQCIEETVEALGLQSCRHTKVGNIFFKGISGGQARRLSIAVEVISHPSIMLLDEPTSGLDSRAAFSVMEHIVKLAADGRTFVCTIHQPSSALLNKFKKLMLLSQGKVIYAGPTDKCLDFFSSLGYPCPALTNPADHYLDLINVDFDNHIDIDKATSTFFASEVAQKEYELVKKYENASEHIASNTSNLNNNEEKSTFATPRWHQYWTLTKRQLLSNGRDPGVYWIRMVMYLMLGIMLGSVYYKLGNTQGSIVDRISILFFMSAFMVFMSVAAIPFFINERGIFLRERANGTYSVDAYAFAVAMAALPGVFGLALLSSGVAYPMVGLHAGGSHYAWFLLDLFLVLYAAEGFELMMASLVPHYIIGIAMSAGTFAMFMLAQGYFVLLRRLPDYWIWIHYMAMHTYSFRTFMSNEFKGLKFQESTRPGVPTLFRTGEEVMKYYELNFDTQAGDMGILISMAAIYFFMFYAILYFRHTGKK